MEHVDLEPAVTADVYLRDDGAHQRADRSNADDRAFATPNHSAQFSRPVRPPPRAFDSDYALRLNRRFTSDEVS